VTGAVSIMVDLIDPEEDRLELQRLRREIEKVRRELYQLSSEVQAPVPEGIITPEIQRRRERAVTKIEKKIEYLERCVAELEAKYGTDMPLN
jgi:hypothetical protein